VNEDPFDLAKFELTPEQVAKLAPFEKKPKSKPKLPRSQRAAGVSFIQLPYAPAETVKLGNMQLAVLMEIAYLAFKAHGRPTPLANKALELAGVNHDAKVRVLRQLEKAGLIVVVWRGRGKSPQVSLRWD
jgi:hypothetical protein